MNVLPHRAVKRTGLELTVVGLGCAQLGNLYRAVDDGDAAATVDEAWSLGIRYFDTAPHYGLGLSERRLGSALAGRSRDDYVVSTKVGRRLDALTPPYGRDDEGFDVPATHRRVWDFSREGVLRSLEQSLERLGVDRIDVVFIHDPDNHWQEAAGQAYPALDDLRRQGVVSSIGAGMNQADMLAEFVRHTDIDIVMLAGRYTLLDQRALEELLPLCVEREVGVVAAGVFNSGILARDDPPENANYDYGQASPDTLGRARRIAAVCRRHGIPVPAAAIAFPLAHPAIVGVCLGARSPQQIRLDIDLYRTVTPAALWSELRAEHLLPAAPTPA